LHGPYGLQRGAQYRHRQSARRITLFDSVGFAFEDFSALRYVREQLGRVGLYEELDLLADPDEPRDLFGRYVTLAKVMSHSPRIGDFRAAHRVIGFPKSLSFLDPIIGRSKRLTSKSRERDNAVGLPRNRAQVAALSWTKNLKGDDRENESHDRRG
jgi:Ornithine cyclodeaminase/mu-crystallin family